MAEVYATQDILTPAVGSPSLGRIRPMELIQAHDERATYMGALGLFGTAGNPDVIYDWRAEVLPTIHEALAGRGVDGRVTVYNPLKRDWNPSDAAEEALHLARDAALVLPVLDLTTGHASLAETGFAALGGTLRPQRVHMFIESGQAHDDATRRARSLTTMLARQTLQDFRINAKMAPDLASMVSNGVNDVSDFVEEASSRVLHENRYTIMPRTDLAPRVSLVGSGAPRYSDSWYEGILGRLQDAGLESHEVFSAYAKDWTEDNAVEELAHKTNDAVVLFAVTETENSFGAMGELGWLITYCVMNGQRLGIYVERHDSDPKSDANRQRKLAMAHLGRQLLDFPDLPVFVANSPAELARYGATELAKYKQLQMAHQVAGIAPEDSMSDS